jgi:hypothetical protein
MANAEDYLKYLSIPPDRMHRISLDATAGKPPSGYSPLEQELYDRMTADADAFKARYTGEAPIVHEHPFDAGAD